MQTDTAPVWGVCAPYAFRDAGETVWTGKKGGGGDLAVLRYIVPLQDDTWQRVLSNSEARPGRSIRRTHDQPQQS